MVAGIKKEHQQTAKLLMVTAAKVLSGTDKDGVGYAAITNKGKIYGEKWVRKEDAFVVRNQPKVKASAVYINDLLADAAKTSINLDPENTYMNFGNLTKDAVKGTVAMILHARSTTVGEKSLANTHPFYVINDPDEKIEDIALVHNGTIHNHMSLTKKTSTCDSEVILHEYIKQDINYNPYNINEVSEALRGQYTVGVLSSYDNNGTIQPILDIFKSNKDLCVGYCPELQTALFCTWEYPLKEICKEAGVSIENIVDIKDDLLLRIDAVTGKRMEDLIPFNKKVITPWVNPGETGRGTAATNIHALPAPRTSIQKELDVLKNEFEKKHPSIFNIEYKGGDLELTKEEEEIMLNMSKEEEVWEFRAAELVRRVVGNV